MSADFENQFNYHVPFGDQSKRYQILRDKAKDLARLYDSLCPDSREKSLAFTNLKQAEMWAHAAIAINEKEIV